MIREVSPEQKTIRQTNEAAARIKKEHPGRFLFCAALPLLDVQKAIEEAKYALDVLKADGIKLATNANGQYLGVPLERTRHRAVPRDDSHGERTQVMESQLQNR